MPKRKATQQQVDYYDGFVSGTDINTGDDANTAAPPAKRVRGRPKSVATKASKTKTTPRKARSTVVLGPKRRGGKAAGGIARQQGSASQDEEKHDESVPESSEDELDSPKTTVTAAKHKSAPQSGTKRGRKKEPERKLVKDGEFEYTPISAREERAPPSPAQTTRRREVLRAPSIEPKGQYGNGYDEDEVPEQADEPDHEDHEAIEENEDSDASLPLPSPMKKLIREIMAFDTTSQKRKSLGPTKTDTSTEVMLRRKLGDATKKLQAMEKKYRDLREVGIVQASANVESLRQQCESITSTSNAFIASLKKELAAQTKLAKESQALQDRLSQRDDEVSALTAKVGTMTADLGKAQTEIKTLQTKLTASRTALTNAEQLKVSGNASSRSAMASNAESAQALQVAQLKEDLYSDLTGLIIRDVKRRDVDYLYDCIQTGLNGTLHFKLAVADDTDNKVTTDLEAAEFQYMPLLDQNRDRKLLEILPDYLSVDITFSRQHASKFYSRVSDILTRKRAYD